MPLLPEEIVAAKKMREFARWYVVQRRSRMISLAVSFTISCLCSSRLITNASPQPFDHMAGWFGLGLTLGICVMAITYLHQQHARYENSISILKMLEREHGEELPWMEEKRQEAEVKLHLAALQDLERELAKDRAAS